jgi:PAS domain S-box-containing protein
MILAYTNFDHLTIIWATLSVLGLLAAAWSIRQSFLDRRALRQAQDVDPVKANVNLSTLLEELTRGFIHIIFLVIAALGMLVAPAYIAKHTLLREVITYAFVIIPGVLGLASVIAFVMRRRLETMLRKTAELEQINAELADAQQIAQIGSWEWDISAKAISWSDELYRMTGIDPEECGASFEAYLNRVHPDDRDVVEADAQTMYADRSTADFEHRIVRPDGTVRTVQGRGKVVADGTGRPIRMYGTIQDVTEEKRAQEEADRLKNDFLALVSHELRTPLTSIKGYLEVLLDDEDGELNDGQRESTEIAYRNASRLQRLVGDLLTLSKLDSDAIRFQRRPVDLALMARELEQEFRPTAAQRKIGIAVVAEEDAIVFGDPLRLGQSLANLLSNAIKFSPDGGTVEVHCHRTGGEIVLEVADSGIGIAAHELARIGQRFYRGSNANTIQGTGLGLAIAREILERHGGRLEVESELGVGSAFRAWVPVDQRHGLALEQATNPQTAASSLPPAARSAA